MIPVLRAAIENRRDLLRLNPPQRHIPARQILDRWEPEARTPVPGSRRASAGVSTRATGSGSPKVAAPADPQVVSPARAASDAADRGALNEVPDE
jgi:hypothetical protein